MTFELTNADAIQVTGGDADPDMIPFYLRGESFGYACSKGLTSCSACRRCRGSSRIGTKSRPYASS